MNLNINPPKIHNSPRKRLELLVVFDVFAELPVVNPFHINVLIKHLLYVLQRVIMPKTTQTPKNRFRFIQKGLIKQRFNLCPASRNPLGEFTLAVVLASTLLNEASKAL